MASRISFKTARGGEPSERVLQIKKALRPTEDDLLYAGQRQRTRILARTARGVDLNEKPFKKYSDRGPYYYNPTWRTAAIFTQKQAERVYEGRATFRDLWRQKERAAAKRFLGKITKKSERGKDGAPRLSGTGRTVRFESYAAFKRWLGRAAIDLRGPRAPHMLQKIHVVARSARELVLGVYGEAAARAQGHNEGSGNLPKRHFFGASEKDAKQMIRDIYQRIRMRLVRK